LPGAMPLRAAWRNMFWEWYICVLGVEGARPAMPCPTLPSAPNAPSQLSFRCPLHTTLCHTQYSSLQREISLRLSEIWDHEFMLALLTDRWHWLTFVQRLVWYTADCLTLTRGYNWWTNQSQHWAVREQIKISIWIYWPN
jgi:hypothetical protein